MSLRIRLLLSYLIFILALAGQISVQSQLMQGSIFTIFLPPALPTGQKELVH
jgi:signal transduction histidine kinase